MFSFFQDMFNHEQRVVANDEVNGATVDTAYVSDGRQPIETGVQHPDYNDGAWVIVEAYDNKDQALEGHRKWVSIMTTEPLPAELVDCLNSEISQVLSDFSGGRLAFPRIANVQSRDSLPKL